MSTSANEHKHNNNGDDGEEESKPEVEQTGSCACACCRTCCSAIEAKLKPCMSEHNPLPENPTCCDRFRYAFLCPPHGKLAKWITRLLLLVVTWALLWVLIGNEALPPGWVFALLILYAACTVAGYLTTFLKLPPLLGMLLLGAVLRNVPYIDIAKTIPRQWSANIRTVALVVILIKAGLGLKADELRRLSLVVPRLSLVPCLVEGAVVGVVSHYILKFPWAWAFVLGFIMAALSPAVVVNYMLPLAEQGYGVEKGIPTLIVGSMTIDNVAAIAAFGIALGVAMAEGFSAYSVIKGPLEIVIGIAYGSLVGVLLWYFPKQKSKNLALYRFWLLFASCLFATFACGGKLEMRSAGPIASLCAAFVASIGWKRQGWPHKNPIFLSFCKLWTFLEPFLFGLVGAGVDIQTMIKNPTSVGWGILILFIGLAIRMLVAMVTVVGQGLNMKEKVFVALAWFPKATVQAAIGSIPLDAAKGKGDKAAIEIATQIATISAIAIFIAAPLGAAFIMLLGPKLLKKEGDEQTTPEEEEEKGDGASKEDRNGSGTKVHVGETADIDIELPPKDNLTVIASGPIDDVTQL